MIEWLSSFSSMDEFLFLKRRGDRNHRVSQIEPPDNATNPIQLGQPPLYIFSPPHLPFLSPPPALSSFSVPSVPLCFKPLFLNTEAQSPQSCPTGDSRQSIPHSTPLYLSPLPISPTDPTTESSSFDNCRFTIPRSSFRLCLASKKLTLRGSLNRRQRAIDR